MESSTFYELRFLNEKYSGEMYLRDLCQGKDGKFGREAAYVYAYKALGPLIDSNRISKDTYYSSGNETFRDECVNSLVYFLKRIMANPKGFKELYPQMFDVRGNLSISDACAEINEFFGDYVAIRKNCKNDIGDTEFIMENYPGYLDRKNYFALFSEGSDLRKQILRISEDKNFGFDLNIYEALEGYLIGEGISFRDYLDDHERRSDYREIFSGIKSSNKDYYGRNSEFSDEEILRIMSLRSLEWDNYCRGISDSLDPELRSISFEEFMMLGDIERKRLLFASKDSSRKAVFDEDSVFIKSVVDGDFLRKEMQLEEQRRSEIDGLDTLINGDTSYIVSYMPERKEVTYK